MIAEWLRLRPVDLMVAGSNPAAGESFLGLHPLPKLFIYQGEEGEDAKEEDAKEEDKLKASSRKKRPGQLKRFSSKKRPRKKTECVCYTIIFTHK